MEALAQQNAKYFSKATAIIVSCDGNGTNVVAQQQVKMVVQEGNKLVVQQNSIKIAQDETKTMAQQEAKIAVQEGTNVEVQESGKKAVLDEFGNVVSFDEFEVNSSGIVDERSNLFSTESFGRDQHADESSQLPVSSSPQTRSRQQTTPQQRRPVSIIRTKRPIRSPQFLNKVDQSTYL